MMMMIKYSAVAAYWVNVVVANGWVEELRKKKYMFVGDICQGLKLAGA
jgi:hypothetical protein